MKTIDIDETYLESMLLRDYDNKLSFYMDALHRKGLTHSDYDQIQRDLHDLGLLKRAHYREWFEYVRLNKHILLDDRLPKHLSEEYIKNRDMKWMEYKKVDDLMGEYYDLMSLLRASIPIGLKEFLGMNTSVTHLLYTNHDQTKIRICSFDSFMFACHFHLEKTPSLGVINSLGLGKCYGCGVRFNSIGYLERYEDLSHREAISLLARIYLIDIDGDIKGNPRLEQKYRDILISDDFRKLLELGRKKAESKAPTWERNRALQKYAKDFDTIERVKRGEHISFVEENDRPKRLVLDMPNSHH